MVVDAVILQIWLTVKVALTIPAFEDTVGALMLRQSATAALDGGAVIT